MAPKRSTISMEEWEHHKETIIGLFSEKPLKKVMGIMKNEYNFEASVYQFETQLRSVWGIRKNSKMKELEALFKNPSNINAASELGSVWVTPIGREKPRAAFKRAERYYKKRKLRDQSSSPRSDSNDGQGTSQLQGSVTDRLVESLPDSTSSFNIGDASLNFEVTLAGPDTASLNELPDGASLFPSTNYDYGMFESVGSSLSLQHAFNDSFDFRTPPPVSSFPYSSYSPPNLQVPEQCGVSNGLQFWPQTSSHLVKLLVDRKIPQSSLFVEFEQYLASNGFSLTRPEPARSRGAISLSSSCFTLRSFADIAFSKQRALTRGKCDIESAIQQLVTLLPIEPAAIASQGQSPETKLLRSLIFSLLNGSVGLENIPMGNLLQFLGRAQVVTTSLLRLLKYGPRHASRTFVDKIFLASIEAKNENVLRHLLELQLVDVNNTICHFGKKKYTPVERAAYLGALKLVRLLVDADADVNKTYDPTECGAALHNLLCGACNASSRWIRNWGYTNVTAVTATSEILEILEILIEAGTKVDPNAIGVSGETFTTYDVASRLSTCVSPRQHEGYFQVQGRYNLFVQIARYDDEHHASQIIRNVMDHCRRDECGQCLIKYNKEVESAAIEAAKVGHIEVVQLLIDHVPSTTGVFTAAIVSNNKDLIDFVLSGNPELDPPALRLNSGAVTTPLAEAITCRNEKLIHRLHKAGALERLNEGLRFLPLVFASARWGNISYMQMLLCRANTSLRPFDPPLGAISTALEHGHEDIAWLLIHHCNSWNQEIYVENASTSVVYLAIKRRNASMVRCMLNSGYQRQPDYIFGAALEWKDFTITSDILSAYPNIHIDSSEATIWCRHCMREDRMDLFQKVFESVFIDSGVLKDCLCEAIEMGHPQMITYLIDSGANPFDSKVLVSAVHHRPELMQMLLDKDRQRKRAPKCIGAQVLRCVMTEGVGNIEVLDALLNTQTVNLVVAERVDANTRCYVTPLGLALSNLGGLEESSIHIVKKLLEAGSNPNAVARLDCSSKTGLILGIETGRLDIVQLLLDRGAEINQKPHCSVMQAPLQRAVELGNLDMVKILLNYGADVNLEPAVRGGGTALQFAAISGNCNIAAVLLERGAVLDMLPSKVDGRWPLEGAAEYGRLDMIQFLWNARSQHIGEVAGFDRRCCLRAMNFARGNGHMGCRDLISELSGISVERLDVEDYGAPWLAYSEYDRASADKFWPTGIDVTGPLHEDDDLGASWLTHQDDW